MKGSDPGGELTRKQELAIVSLVTSGSLKQAAAAAGCKEVTIWRWLQEPAFKRSYRKARVATVEEGIAQGQRLFLAAVATFAQIMLDKEGRYAQTAFARMQAAGHIKEIALKGTELLDQQERIEDLEEVLLRDDSTPKKKGLHVA